MIIHSEQEMLSLGQQFAENSLRRVATAEGTPRRACEVGEESSRQDPSAASVIELIGDVGTGKTTFTRGLAKGLGVKEPVTSPSFTISKQYALPSGGRLIHYDFYRLQDPGLMAEDLSENLQNPNNVIVIEWGESISDLLPKNHHIIRFEYADDGRKVIL